MPEQIVVGYDGSENSERALDWAIQEAGTLAGELRVVVSMGRPVAVDPSLYGPFLEAIEEEADKVAAAAVTRARDAGVTAVAVVERGDAAGQQHRLAGLAGWREPKHRRQRGRVPLPHSLAAVAVVEVAAR